MLKHLAIILLVLLTNNNINTIQQTPLLNNQVPFIYSSTINTNLLESNYLLNIISDRVDPLRISFAHFIDFKDYIVYFSFNTITPKVVKIVKSDLSITQQNFNHPYKSCSLTNSNLLFYSIYYETTNNLVHIAYFSHVIDRLNLIVYMFEINESLTISNTSIKEITFFDTNKPFFDFIISFAYNLSSDSFQFTYSRQLIVTNNNLIEEHVLDNCRSYHIKTTSNFKYHTYCFLCDRWF